MKAEIEKILQADQTALAAVEAARAQAEAKERRVLEEIAEMNARLERELADAKKWESGQILSEARSMAQERVEQTDRYLQKLQTRLETCREGLIDRLLKGILGD